MKNVFKTGAVLVFISEASGKTLRVMHDGDAQGKGGEGTLGIYYMNELIFESCSPCMFCVWL